jgi:hypothetical protein
MKTLDLSNIQDGVRGLAARKYTFSHIIDSYQEIIASMVNGLMGSPGGVSAIVGCVNSGSGLNYNISAGAVFYNGEVFQVPAFVGTATGVNVPSLSIVTSYIAQDPSLYTDNNSFNTHAIRTMAWTIGASGAGLADLLALTRLSSRYALKTPSAWTTIPLSNGWAVANSATPKYRINELGKVELMGQLDATGASSNNVTATGIMPHTSTYNIQLSGSRIRVSSLIQEAKVVSIQTSGQMIADDRANSITVFLDGLSYNLDV